MPSGPKKRRAAAKKKEQPEKSNVKVEDVISNQETLPVSVAEVVEQFIHNPVEDVVGNGVSEKAGSQGFSSDSVVGNGVSEKAGSQGSEKAGSQGSEKAGSQGSEKAGSQGFSSDSVVTCIEPVQITQDIKSVHQPNQDSIVPVKSISNDIDHESKLSVEKGVSELLASTEPVKIAAENSLHENSLHETNQALDKTAHVIDHESNQDAEKAQSEMVASELLINNEEVKHTTYATYAVVDDESNQTQPGSEMVSSVCFSICEDPVMNTAEEVTESIQAADKAGSETVASYLLMKNEEVKNTTDDVDHESNQTVAKAGSVFLGTCNNPAGINTRDEVVESIQAADKAGSEMVDSEMLMHNEEVRDTKVDVDNESNQTVAKAMSSIFLTTSNDPVMKTTDEVIESIQAADKAGSEMVVQDHHSPVLMEEISVGVENFSATDDFSGIMQEMPKDVENPCDTNDPKSDFQPLQEGVCGCTQCSLVCTLSEIKNMIKCCHLGETIGSSTQVKRVKEILEKELMATEKLRLVLKKALDDLYEAAA